MNFNYFIKQFHEDVTELIDSDPNLNGATFAIGVEIGNWKYDVKFTLTLYKVGINVEIDTKVWGNSPKECLEKIRKQTLSIS